MARAMTIPGTRVSLIFREAMQGRRPNPPVPRNEVASSSNAGLPPPSQAVDADYDPPLTRPQRRWPRPAYQPPRDETLIGDSEDDEPRAITIPGTRVSEAMQERRPNPPVPWNEVASSSNAGLPPPSQAVDADYDPPLTRPQRRWPRPAYQPPRDETLIGDSEDDEPRISNLEFRQQVMQHIRQMEAKMQQFERRLRLATPQTSEPAALGSFDGAEASCVVM